MEGQFIFLSVALGLWLAGWAVWWRVAAARNTLPVASGDQPPRQPTIVIPARNEEHNLPVLLHSLASQQQPPLEVLVVDDGSTDGTAAVAREHGATVLPSLPLPEGWRGKPWACQQGAQAARSEWLLFLDADTWLAADDGLAKILAGYDTGALSVGPYHEVRRPYEQLSAFFNLVMMAGTVPTGLFGQMLLVDRASYWRVGGHAAVRGRTLENVFLAALFRQAGVTVRSMTGRGLLALRMYPHGLQELVDGWTKGFASGAGQTPKPVLWLLVAWLSGLMLTVVLLPFTAWALALYGLCAGQVALVLRRVGAFRWYTAAAYPVALVFFFAVFARSAWWSGRAVTWKGRAIRAD